jgi:hypothetical protein
MKGPAHESSISKIETSGARARAVVAFAAFRFSGAEVVA